MKVLVTGGAGFLGRRVVALLASHGHVVHVVDPELRAHHAPGESVSIEDWVGYFMGDHAGYFYPDVVVHLASPVGPLGILRGAGVAGRILAATSAVIELALGGDMRVINVSTSEVYGSGGVYEVGDPCVTPHRYSRRLAYATGKLAAEMDIHAALGDRVVTLRPFNVVGGDQDALAGFVLPRLVDQALDGDAMTIYRPGTQRRALLAADDFARLVEVLVDGDPWPGGEMLHAGAPGNECDVFGLVGEIRDAVAVLTGRYPKDPVLVDPVALHGPAFEEAEGMTKLPTITETTRLTGWSPSLSLSQIVVDAVRVRVAERRVRVPG